MRRPGTGPLARIVGAEFGARAVVVDARDDHAAQFHRHFGFHDLGNCRLWRRLSDVRAALAE